VLRSERSEGLERWDKASDVPLTHARRGVTLARPGPQRRVDICLVRFCPPGEAAEHGPLEPRREDLLSERRADREFTAKQKTELVLAVLKAVVGLRRNGRVQGFLERDRVRRWSKRWTGRDQASAGQPARWGSGDDRGLSRSVGVDRRSVEALGRLAGASAQSGGLARRGAPAGGGHLQRVEARRQVIGDRPADHARLKQSIMGMASRERGEDPHEPWRTTQRTMVRRPAWAK